MLQAFECLFVLEHNRCFSCTSMSNKATSVLQQHNINLPIRMQPSCPAEAARKTHWHQLRKWFRILNMSDLDQCIFVQRGSRSMQEVLGHVLYRPALWLRTRHNVLAPTISAQHSERQKLMLGLPKHSNAEIRVPEATNQRTLLNVVYRMHNQMVQRTCQSSVTSSNRPWMINQVPETTTREKFQ